MQIHIFLSVHFRLSFSLIHYNYPTISSLKMKELKPEKLTWSQYSTIGQKFRFNSDSIISNELCKL